MTITKNSLLGTHKIKGVIIQPWRKNILFEGSFEYQEGDKSLEGMMEDFYGSSSVNGTLNFDSKEMNFTKIYLERNKNPFSYKFRKERDLWRGEYRAEGRFCGSSFCEVIKFGEKYKVDWERDVNKFVMDEDSIGKYSSELAREMENRGYVDITDDGKLIPK
ncbi:MAG TPA: hypothetical protein VJZ93_03380 [Candidatus Nanoarchaeia archaeon]|nr:hypothetical protein [Candidatus Nanoarchaeia archaeon]